MITSYTSLYVAGYCIIFAEIVNIENREYKFDTQKTGYVADG